MGDFVGKHELAVQAAHQIYALLFHRQVAHRRVVFRQGMQAVSADLVYRRYTRLFQQAGESPHHLVFAVKGRRRAVALEHHAVHAHLRGFGMACFKFPHQRAVWLASQRRAHAMEPVQRAGVAVGHTRDTGCMAVFFENLRRRQGFAAQDEVELRRAAALNGFHVRIQTEAGAHLHAEGLAHQAANFIAVAAGAVSAGGEAEQVVRAFDALIGRRYCMLGNEPVGLAQADAVVAAEAALFEGDEVGAHLFLHVGAYAAQVRADDGGDGRGDHKDNARHVGLVDLHERALQPGNVAHDHVVFAHVGGEQAVLLVYAEASEEADAVVRGARGAVFQYDAALDAQKAPEDAHAVGGRGQIAAKAHAAPPSRRARASLAAVQSARTTNAVTS